MNQFRPSIPGMLSLAFVLCTIGTMSAPSEGAGRPLASSEHTNGRSTRRAFTEVVDAANRWTVRVESDGEEVAFGVIVEADGYIITKASRLRDQLMVRLPNDRKLSAEYIGYHPKHDLALLKINAKGLDTVEWQEEADPAVGRWVVTPDQQGAPRAVGVLSVTRREIPEVKVRGVLGIRLDGPNNSATVQEVFPKSAADLCGLEPGDVIQRVNDFNVDSRGALMQKIAEYSPGERLVLKVRREKQELDLKATLTHPFGDFLSRIAMQNQMGGALSERRTGFPLVIQHDSVLQPEECGGPLVDLSGKAIGINIARAGRTESYAIPDDVVRQAVDELLTGKFPPPQVKLAGFTVPQGQNQSSQTGGE